MRLVALFLLWSSLTAHSRVDDILVVSEQEYIQGTSGAPFRLWPHTSYGYTMGRWDGTTYQEQFRAVIPFQLEQYWGGRFLYDRKANEPVLVSPDNEGRVWLIPHAQSPKLVTSLVDGDALASYSDDTMLVDGEADEIKTVDIQGNVNSFLSKGWLFSDPAFLGPHAGFSFMEYYGDGRLLLVNPKYLTLVEVPPKRHKIIQQWPIHFSAFAQLGVLTFLDTKAVLLPSGETQIWVKVYCGKDNDYALGIRLGPKQDEYRWLELPRSDWGDYRFLDIATNGDLHLTDQSDHLKIEWANPQLVTLSQYEFSDMRWQQRGMAIPTNISYRISGLDLPRTGHSHISRSRPHATVVMQPPQKPTLPANFRARKNLDPTTFVLAVETLAWMYDEFARGTLPATIKHGDLVKMMADPRFRFIRDYFLDLTDAELAPFGLLSQGLTLVAMPGHKIVDVDSAELADLLVRGTASCAAKVAARNPKP